ncbi:hypothetical protein PUR28_12380 [Streptomyces sp. BE308]|uniref:hypothetical protein n=1 Tax=Streptomyces sp. BE308 TaxID=3002529 RepID=UPI002E7826C6|nr:hypothetical protein [Streptomyces sp. BE308]MEE1791552.1 hypothetical protein [Streptomyces sp. BE308]
MQRGRAGAYQPLAEEFSRRLKGLQDTGEIIDPRAAQIERLKEENAELRGRVSHRDAELAGSKMLGRQGKSGPRSGWKG